MRIGIDMMGGDSPPQVLFEAVKLAAEQLDASYSLMVIATKSVADQLKADYRLNFSKPAAFIEFRVVADAIAMGDEPLGAVRRKKNSSIVVGMRLLKKKAIDAFVSTGNTGALVASASLSLSKLPGIKRPALLTMLPAENKSVAVIDVGGNVSCKALHLMQFAYLGAAYYRAIYGKQSPAVGLLNIGVESKKGTTELREAYKLLKSQSSDPSFPMHFFGNIEAREVFQGAVDVLVTDGFTGNVLLKAAEGVAEFIFGALDRTLKSQQEEIHRNLEELRKPFNYAEYPGAFICGVDGIVIKCHGRSSVKALLSGIKGAFDLVNKKVIDRINVVLTH